MEGWVGWKLEGRSEVSFPSVRRKYVVDHWGSFYWRQTGTPENKGIRCATLKKVYKVSRQGGTTLFSVQNLSSSNI